MNAPSPAAPSALDASALERVRRLNEADHADALGLYDDSPRRKSMRELLEACAATGATVTIEYFKKDYTPRVLRCRVCPGEDRTCRYVTVWDIEAADYRRVCLDHVVRLTVDPLA